MRYTLLTRQTITIKIRHTLQSRQTITMKLTYYAKSHVNITTRPTVTVSPLFFNCSVSQTKQSLKHGNQILLQLKPRDDQRLAGCNA